MKAALDESRLPAQARGAADGARAGARGHRPRYRARAGARSGQARARSGAGGGAWPDGGLRKRASRARREKSWKRPGRSIRIPTSPRLMPICDSAIPRASGWRACRSSPRRCRANSRARWRWRVPRSMRANLPPRAPRLRPISRRRRAASPRLMAEIEEAEHGDEGRVREWMARAMRASGDPVWTADGVVSEHWLPVSPNGRLDGFQWKVPLAEIGVSRPVIEAAPPAVGTGRIAWCRKRSLSRRSNAVAPGRKTRPTPGASKASAQGAAGRAGDPAGACAGRSGAGSGPGPRSGAGDLDAAGGRCLAALAAVVPLSSGQDRRRRVLLANRGAAPISVARPSAGVAQR